MSLLMSLYNDEAGFIVSAELVLVATIGVLGLLVGLSEIAWGLNEEMEDVGAAFGSVNQSYAYRGTAGCKGFIAGSHFEDEYDECDSQFNLSCDIYAEPESY